MPRAQRGWTAVEAAVAFAVLAGSLAAVVPSCLRSIRLARTAEAAENLEKLVGAASRHVADKSKPKLIAAPLTPAAVPRGQTVSDPPGTWDHPTWKTLGFAIEEPHWFSYRVDVDVDPQTPVRVTAHGDLDGDGVLSTFQRSVGAIGNDVAPRPGLVVSSELE